MSRRHLSFACGTDTLVGTLDEGMGRTGLLLVSGGSEVRCGAFCGQAQLAAQLAARGHPVLRYDRRGIGDSSGADPGFRGSAPDIAAALEAFRNEAPQLNRVVAFGNCDAASALMLAHGGHCDGLVLANPWTFEGNEAEHAPAAVRARYAAKLKDPSELMRFAKGGVSLQKLVGGIAQALRPKARPTTLAQEMRKGIAHFPGQVRFLIAERDRTGQAFVAAWDPDDVRIQTCSGASHAFVEPDAREWLLEELSDALSE